VAATGRGDGRRRTGRLARLRHATEALALATLFSGQLSAPVSAARAPDFQPVSIAFLDRQHGVLAEEDWSCGKPRGCPARILVSDDGGRRWTVTVSATRPLRLDAVRGSSDVRASTGMGVIESRDRGVTWRRVLAHPAAVSFATARDGGMIPTAATLDRSVTLLATRDGGRSWHRRSNPCRGDFGLTAALSLTSPTRGWVWEDRGWLLMTSDGGTHWQKSSITRPDAIAAQSASRLDDEIGYVLLRGCSVRLVRTADAGRSWTTVKRWPSASRC
jgi:photosystem II stability/assembly factor-like uncharacterized protein